MPARAKTRDWVRDRRSYLLAWGLPTAALIGGIVIDPFGRTVVWTLALVWKGAACLLNARRCRRTHCHLTGPFYLLLAFAVVLHGTGTVPLGSYGWWWLGSLALAGGLVVWLVSERIWGRYLDRRVA